MRGLTFMCLVAVSACGSSGAGVDSGAIDPAARDACLAWSFGVCRLAYICVDPASQDATFRARFGADQDACFPLLQRRCLGTETGSGAFGPSCGPGKAVNQAALQACEDRLDSYSCVDWNASQSGGCEGICGASSGADAGAGTEGGGSDASGSVATPVELCFTWSYLLCDRLYQCNPTQAGTVASCRANADAICPGLTCVGTYYPEVAAMCVAETRTASCDVIINGPDPASCDMSCP